MFQTNPYKDGKTLRNFTDLKMYVKATECWMHIVLRGPSRYQLKYLNRLGKNIKKIFTHDDYLQREYEEVLHVILCDEWYTERNTRYKEWIEKARQIVKDMNLPREVYEELGKYELTCYKREGIIK